MIEPTTSLLFLITGWAFHLGSYASPVSIYSPAVTYYMREEKVEFSSPVTFYSKELSGAASGALLDRRSGLLTLFNGFKIFFRGDSVSGRKCVVDIKNKTVTFEDASVSQSRGGHRVFVRGKSFSADISGTYSIKDAIFTTCQCTQGERPVWSVKFNSAKLTEEGYLKIKDANFKLYDLNLPLFYFPYLVLPSKIQRQSGFLTPRFEYYENLGFFARIGYYQVLSDWSDLTLSARFYHKRGVGGGVNLRYALPYASGGSHSFYYIDEFISGTGRFWSFRTDHIQNFPGAGVRLFSNGVYYSDTSKLSLYSRYVSAYYVPYTTLNFGIDDRISDGGLFFTYRRFQPVSLNDRQFDMFHASFLSPGYSPFRFLRLTFDTGAFGYGEGLENNGIYLQPALSLTFRKFAYVEALIEGQGSYASTPSYPGHRWRMGLRASAEAGVPLIYPGENFTHTVKLEAGWKYREKWAEYPYGISEGAYFFLDSVRSVDYTLRLRQYLRYVFLSLALFYSHHWIRDQVKSYDLIQYEEVSSSLSLVKTVNIFWRGLYNSSGGKWELLRTGLVFNGGSLAHAIFAYSRRLNTEQISTGLSLALPGRVRVAFSHVFTRQGKNSGSWHMTGSVYSFSYTSSQRCWGFVLSYITRDYGGDVVSFQIKLTGMGTWGRSEAL